MTDKITNFETMQSVIAIAITTASMECGDLLKQIDIAYNVLQGTSDDKFAGIRHEESF